MDNIRYEMIRRRAHEIWVAEGQPDFMEEEIWCRAELEISQSETAIPASMEQAGRNTEPLKASAA